MIEDFLKLHGEYSDNKTFKELTTIKMGGSIRHYVCPFSFDDVKEIVNYLKINHISFKLVGNGSNLICGETPYDGVVICLKNINKIEINDDEVYAEAGAMIPLLASKLAKNGLSGLEFAGGIPGNVGGLTYMNAGAYKSDMSAVISEVLVLKNDEYVWIKKNELNFSYRYSIFQEHPHWVVLAIKMKLKKDNPDKIEALMSQRLQRRKESQPLDEPSAGSCFRNPENDFAWKYIDELGYRGHKIGGVQISEKHSNFLINCGNGIAQDYLTIVYDIQKEVKDKYNIKLITEVEKFNC